MVTIEISEMSYGQVASGGTREKYREKDTMEDLNVLERSQGKIREPLWSF